MVRKGTMKLPTLLTNVPAMSRRTTGGRRPRSGMGLRITGPGTLEHPRARPKPAWHDGSMRLRRPLAVAAIAFAVGCAPAINFPDPAGPRYTGSYAGLTEPDGLRVVTFNVKYGRQAQAAADLLKSDPRLSGADLIALQEMDEVGTELIARALSMNYVYYPAAVHPVARRNFGNAVLSRWPLEDDAKLVLPHRGRLRKSVRIAVGATMRVPGREPIRVYSVHLETPGSISGRGRRDQAETILADAASHPRVIV